MPQRTGRDGDKLLPDVPSCTGGTKSIVSLSKLSLTRRP